MRTKDGGEVGCDRQLAMSKVRFSGRASHLDYAADCFLPS